MLSSRAHKWIATESIGTGRRLVVNDRDSQKIFGSIDRNPVNIISIFGRARQGKSFLMNCLSGEQETFRVSNEKDSCTQGIDISEKLIDLREFSLIDGGRSIRSTANMKIGFVDAEGQGDRNVTYDATLVCPILLVSKCVIFNWKGDLQKDHILETLGIMTKAASNVESSISEDSTGRNASKFSHLHIVFRDWQAEGSDSRSVYDALFILERTADASTRDRIRAEVLSSFASVQVWLFDAPSDSVADLRTRLTIDRTTPEFRAQVRQLRSVLTQQLSEPTLFAGQKITGQSIGPIISGVAESLNQGNVVLPASMFFNMMRMEVDKLRQWFEQTLADELTRACGELQERITSVLVHRTSELPTRFADFQAAVNARVEALRQQLDEGIEQCIGDVTADIRASLLTLFHRDIERALATSNDQLASKYKVEFSRWLLAARNLAEQKLTDNIVTLCSQKDTLFTETSLREECEELYRIARNSIGADYFDPSPELADAVAIITRAFEIQVDGALQTNALKWEALRRAQRAQEEAEEQRQQMLQRQNDALEDAAMAIDSEDEEPEEGEMDNLGTPLPVPPPRKTELSVEEQQLRARAFFASQNVSTSGKKKSSSRKAAIPQLSAAQQRQNALAWAMANKLQIDGKKVTATDVAAGADTSTGPRQNESVVTQASREAIAALQRRAEAFALASRNKKV